MPCPCAQRRPAAALLPLLRPYLVGKGMQDSHIAASGKWHLTTGLGMQHIGKVVHQVLGISVLFTLCSC